MEEFDHFWTTLKIMNGHPCLIGNTFINNVFNNSDVANIS